MITKSEKEFALRKLKTIMEGLVTLETQDAITERTYCRLATMIKDVMSTLEKVDAADKMEDKWVDRDDLEELKERN